MEDKETGRLEAFSDGVFAVAITLLVLNIKILPDDVLTNGNFWGKSGLGDRKSTRLNSSHSQISYAVFCLKKKQACASIRAASAARWTCSAVNRNCPIVPARSRPAGVSPSRFRRHRSARCASFCVGA